MPPRVWIWGSKGGALKRKGKVRSNLHSLTLRCWDVHVDTPNRSIRIRAEWGVRTGITHLQSHLLSCDGCSLRWAFLGKRGERTETVEFRLRSCEETQKPVPLLERLRGEPRSCSVLSQDSGEVHGVGLRLVDYQAPSAWQWHGDFNAPNHNVLKSIISHFGIVLFLFLFFLLKVALTLSAKIFYLNHQT